MLPIPADCLLCGAPLKNDVCPSCGWNPTAPNPGKSEAEQREEQEVAALRVKLGALPVSPNPNAIPVATGAVSAPVMANPDDDLRGYLLGLGYKSDAIPGILAANHDAIRASFEKAKAQQVTAPAGGPAVPQVSPPPVKLGW